MREDPAQKTSFQGSRGKATLSCKVELGGRMKTMHGKHAGKQAGRQAGRQQTSRQQTFKFIVWRIPKKDRLQLWLQCAVAEAQGSVSLHPLQRFDGVRPAPEPVRRPAWRSPNRGPKPEAPL